MELIEKFVRRNIFLVSLILIVIYGLVISIILIPQLFSLLKEYSVLVSGVLALLALVIALDSMYKNRAERIVKLNEYERIRSEETHPFFYRSIIKEVKILDENGNATVSYENTCKNTSGKPIPQLKHEIKHDGTLEACSATVNQKEAKATFEKFIVKKIVDGEIEPRLSHILKIKFDLSDERIESEALFSYGYSLRYKSVFSNMFKKRMEFTAHHIMHPTRLLVLRVYLPRGLRFLREELDIEVLDKHEVRDFREETRCKEMYNLRVSREGKEVLWELPEPKIACTYRVHFRVSKT